MDIGLITIGSDAFYVTTYETIECKGAHGRGILALGLGSEEVSLAGSFRSVAKEAA